MTAAGFPLTTYTTIRDDIAMVPTFLASPAPDYVTGELIVVDGGRLLTSRR